MKLSPCDITPREVRCLLRVVVLPTSEVGGLVNEGRHHQQSAVLFAESRCPLLWHQVKFGLLLLDAQPPGDDLLLYLGPAVLLVLLACPIRREDQHKLMLWDCLHSTAIG